MTNTPRRKFFKVYSAPGYPVDPARDLARALDNYINSFHPQDRRVFDYTALHRWLLQNTN